MQELQNFNNRLGNIVRETRKNRGWTIADLAKESHVSSTVITDLENGRSIPKVSVIAKLCKSLDVSVDISFKVGNEKIKEPVKDSLSNLSNIDKEKVLEYIKFLEFEKSRV